MQSKIMQLIITYLIKPLMMDGLVALKEWFQEKNRKRKLKKENKKKLKEHKNVKTKKAHGDSFNNLP